MMKKYILLVNLLFVGLIHAQTPQQPPTFPGCEGMEMTAKEACFFNKLQSFVYDNFKAPEGTGSSNKAQVNVLFEVNESGKFIVQYVDAPQPELAAESRRVFELLPQISPATYNDKPTYSKYTIRIDLPLQKPGEIVSQPTRSNDRSSDRPTRAAKVPEAELTEFDSIRYLKFDEPQYSSHLNVPFSHNFYSHFDDEINQVGSNSHTASKPLTYSEVSGYYDFKAFNRSIRMSTSGWVDRKLWDENLVRIKGEGYWFTLDPILDLRYGKNSPGEVKSTFVNTRGIRVQGGITDQINFSTTIFESQGRFADYYNAYAMSIAPSGGGPAIIPGIGIAKEFKEDAFDFPMAEAQVTFTPNRHFNLQFGYGRNFIGDGYRSLLQGDGTSPYPFFKINTTFWKIKYTNTYMWMKDVRPEVTEERTYETKYMANHYLSWNVTKRFNLGFFESVVWANTNGRGFDASFINPIIFYRAVEFASSARSGNALLGLTGKYKVNNSINVYGQFLLDEFSLADVRAGDRSWKNKFGYQLGVKYFNAFGIGNLLLQAEYNHVRPYVYAHSDPLTNYAHNNQSLGHNWGGNFREVIAVARYHYRRYFVDMKMTYGQRGLDFDTAEDSFNYGGNIFKDYEEGRPYDTGVSVGQGNKTNIVIIVNQSILQRNIDILFFRFIGVYNHVSRKNSVGEILGENSLLTFRVVADKTVIAVRNDVIAKNEVLTRRTVRGYRVAAVKNGVVFDCYIFAVGN